MGCSSSAPEVDEPRAASSKAAGQNETPGSATADATAEVAALKTENARLETKNAALTAVLAARGTVHSEDVQIALAGGAGITESEALQAPSRLGEVRAELPARPMDPAGPLAPGLTASSAAALEPTEPPQPAAAVASEWGVAGWLDSEGATQVLAAAMLGESFRGGDELEAMRALGSSATLEDDLLARLTAAVRPLVARLAPLLLALATVREATSGEMQTKFSQEMRAHSLSTVGIVPQSTTLASWGGPGCAPHSVRAAKLLGPQREGRLRYGREVWPHSPSSPHSSSSRWTAPVQRVERFLWRPRVPGGHTQSQGEGAYGQGALGAERLETRVHHEQLRHLHDLGDRVGLGGAAGCKCPVLGASAPYTLASSGAGLPDALGGCTAQAAVWAVRPD